MTAADTFLSLFGLKRAECLSCTHSYMAPDEEIRCDLSGDPIAGICAKYIYEPGTDTTEHINGKSA